MSCISFGRSSYILYSVSLSLRPHFKTLSRSEYLKKRAMMTLSLSPCRCPFSAWLSGARVEILCCVRLVFQEHSLGSRLTPLWYLQSALCPVFLPVFSFQGFLRISNFHVDCKSPNKVAFCEFRRRRCWF